MQIYQICKACKSTFYNGVLYAGKECPICNIKIEDEKKQIKVKSEDKLKQADKNRLERTQKKLLRLKKIREREAKKKVREAKRNERLIKKENREKKKQIKETADNMKIAKKQINVRGYLFDYFVFEELSPELEVTDDYKGYIIISTSPDQSKHEVGFFKKITKYNEVEYIDHGAGLHTVPLDSVRKFIKGHDKLGEFRSAIHTLKKFGIVPEETSDARA